MARLAVRLPAGFSAMAGVAHEGGQPGANTRRQITQRPATPGTCTSEPTAEPNSPTRAPQIPWVSSTSGPGGAPPERRCLLHHPAGSDDHGETGSRPLVVSGNRCEGEGRLGPLKVGTFAPGFPSPQRAEPVGPATCLRRGDGCGACMSHRKAAHHPV